MGYTYYAIHPGYVVSANDGDRHYIGADRLMFLYNVNPKDCNTWDITNPHTYRGKKWNEYIHLYPDKTGEYKIPKGRAIY